MITNDNTRDKIPDNENKKVWMLPELEVLDGKRTYGGNDNLSCEDYECASAPFGRNGQLTS